MMTIDELKPQIQQLLNSGSSLTGAERSDLEDAIYDPDNLRSVASIAAELSTEPVGDLFEIIAPEADRDRDFEKLNCRCHYQGCDMVEMVIFIFRSCGVELA